MKITDYTELNEKAEKDPARWIDCCEKAYTGLIQATVQQILDKKEARVILIAGPSASGKTTTALRIREELAGQNRQAHVLSIDNYFVWPKDEASLPRTPDGKVDLESPFFVDIPLLRQQVEDLLVGKDIDIPKFDFHTQSRAKEPLKHLSPQKGDMVILEGIHALIPEIFELFEDRCFSVYAAPRTRISLPDGRLLHPRELRFLRRISRDRLFRGKDPAFTLSHYAGVSRGEELYILPFKKKAEWTMDTFLPYEVSLLSGICREDVRNLEPKELRREGLTDLIWLMDHIKILDNEAVPTDSLMREFIGGSCLEY